MIKRELKENGYMGNRFTDYCCTGSFGNAVLKVYYGVESNCCFQQR